MTFKDALEIAQIDYNIGVSEAIFQLEAKNYDCSYYWDKMREAEEDPEADFDYINLEARNELYKRLKIDKIMKRAYKRLNIILFNRYKEG